MQLRLGDRRCELTMADSQIQAEGEGIGFAGVSQALALPGNENISRLK